MLDKSQIRLEIINFFETFCNNKLNKNVYNINFYKNRNSEYIYHFIQQYFKGTLLENSSIAQKYYHIYWNHTDIPSTPFCNFKVGYRKGKRTFSSKSTKWLKAALNNFCCTKHSNVFSAEIAKETLLEHLRKSSYKQLLKNTELLNFILNQQKTIIADNYTKIVLFLVEDKFCVCGNLRKIKKPLQIAQTCGRSQCVVDVAVQNGKNRDISYLQTIETKKKRVKSRSWYRPSEETKTKIVESNKKTWTPERKLQQVEKNRANGVYERSSQKIKEKILAGLYTPKTQNRLTHKRLYSNLTGIKKYRSNWEVIYHEANPHLLYEVIRIPYNYNNSKKVYIVDFWDPVNNIAIEIKPSSMTETPQTVAKINALKMWCQANNATYKIVTEKIFPFYEQK
jgi:hypothetical protein